MIRYTWIWNVVWVNFHESFQLSWKFQLCISGCWYFVSNGKPSICSTSSCERLCVVPIFNLRRVVMDWSLLCSVSEALRCVIAFLAWSMLPKEFKHSFQAGYFAHNLVKIVFATVQQSGFRICQLFTPQPFGLEGYCRHGSGGRAGGRPGGRLPNLRNPYLCNRLTDFLHSKFYGIV